MLIITVLVFSLFDYIGYNLSVRHNWLKIYRKMQIGLQILLFLLLWIISGVIPAMLFMLLWACWVCDWLYYVIDYLSQKTLRISFEGGDSLMNIVTGRTTVSWADFTLYAELSNKKILNNKELIIQAVVGIVISVFVELMR